MQLKMLVLPAPLGPMIARKSWGWTSRLTGARVTTRPNWRYTVSRLSSAMASRRHARDGRVPGKPPRRSLRPTFAPKGCPEIPSRAWLPRGPDSSEDARVGRKLQGPGGVVNTPRAEVGVVLAVALAMAPVLGAEGPPTGGGSGIGRLRCSGSARLFGGPSRTRTLDPLIKSCPEPRTLDTQADPSLPNQSDPD